MSLALIQLVTYEQEWALMLTFDLSKCQTDLFPPVVVPLNKPADRGLGRLGETLQEGGVVFHAVLRHLHCVSVS